MTADGKGSVGGSDPILDRIRAWGKRNGINQLVANPGISTAAVSVILRPAKGGTLDILLLRRQEVERDPWSGQISFPGGRSKPAESLLQTAKRESMEEVGIDLGRFEIVGVMPAIYPGNRAILVTPFVFIAPEDTEVKIDRDEIVDFFWVQLNFFSDEKNSSVYSFSRRGVTFETPSFVVMGKYVVWGMTLRIIKNLLGEI